MTSHLRPPRSLWLMTSSRTTARGTMTRWWWWHVPASRRRDMNATQPKTESPDPNYQQALSAYVERGGEALLARAYDFGREALAQGRSIPELVGLHSRALRAILAAADGRRDTGLLIDSATTFLAETLSPFEMTHRGYRDSLIAWRHINETLEQEIRRIAHTLHDAVETALYRVVQEALTNAARHAHATRIRIEVDQDQDCLRCLIGDDGVGFEVDSCVRRGGLGLRGMRERLSALGGALHIVSAPGDGAEIRFQLPVGS